MPLKALRNLPLALRFLLPLGIVVLVAATLAAPLLDRVTMRWFSRDLDSRGALLATALSASIADAVRAGDTARLRPLFERAAADERLLALALCDADDRLLLASARLPAAVTCATADARARQGPTEAAPGNGATPAAVEAAVSGLAPAAIHVAVQPITLAEATPAAARSAPATGADANPTPGAVGTAARPVRLVLVHDLGFVAGRSRDTRHYVVGLVAVLGLVMTLITLFVAQLSWRGWLASVRAMLRGEALGAPVAAAASELAPFAADLRTRLRDLEDEYRRGADLDEVWTAERLRTLLRTRLSGDQVIVVSNREPYIHDRGDDGATVVRRPASGLVTAVEPVMRACSGTWVAHGSGSADRDTVDADDRVRVPPGHDDYWLRRVWLTEQEEQGYYYGFANEGMWPLCHVAHVRPVFRESDWQAYRAVNQRFADAVVAEARGSDPVVLVQDYHFALLPAMVRAQLPQATILTFWHIPWPNPESFGICPWRNEILQGMLGSTILGFHTRFHCKNFIETVDRCLEARIEHEHSTIAFRDEETFVESYPISIAWPDEAESAAWPAVAECRRRVVERLALPADVCLAVGVDRFDYTKGILERFNAVERLLEKQPQWVGRFVFVQVAAPTRSALDEYRSFQERIERVTARINDRFGRPGYRPVHLLARHHEPAAVTELFRAADICVVTSLHDGMNLVCKEFVAARDDLQGVLVLSRFAGAARELPEALIVNPYHVEETADALHRAALMPAAEQRERMASLRSAVHEHNVFRWAGRMLADAGRWRLRARIEARVRRHQPPADPPPA